MCVCMEAERCRKARDDTACLLGVACLNLMTPFPGTCMYCVFVTNLAPPLDMDMGHFTSIVLLMPEHR